MSLCCLNFLIIIIVVIVEIVVAQVATELSFIKCLLCAISCSKFLLCLSFFNPQRTSYLRFVDIDGL